MSHDENFSAASSIRATESSHSSPMQTLPSIIANSQPFGPMEQLEPASKTHAAADTPEGSNVIDEAVFTMERSSHRADVIGGQGHQSGSSTPAEEAAERRSPPAAKETANIEPLSEGSIAGEVHHSPSVIFPLSFAQALRVKKSCL